MKHLTILPSGYGHWEVTFEFRGKSMTKVTSNSLAIDRWKSRHELKPKSRQYFYTERQAYRALTGLSK